MLPDDIYSVIMEVAGNEKVIEQMNFKLDKQGAWRVELVSSQFGEYVGQQDSYSIFYGYAFDSGMAATAIQRVKERLMTMRARLVREQNALQIVDISNITYALISGASAQTGQFNILRRN